MRRLAALFIPLVLVFGACTKETDTPEKKETIEPFFVKATVSGNAFSAIDSNITYNYGAGFTGIDGQQRLSISFVNTPEVKTYGLETKASEREVYVSWKEDIRSEESPSHLIYSGELQVTNYADRKIRGTFKGLAKRGLLKPESEVEITDGSFFVFVLN